ncbi:MAG: D-alanyl-D-alanine carboxypeptidase family protein, partial [Oscillospiraceae bacterium]
SPKNIVAKSYCLIDASTAQIIAGENYNDKLPIASTTKIMTALIALEQEKKYDYFTVDENAIKVEGTSMGLRAGDRISFYELAKGMLLCSGNDAANAAAYAISGNNNAFAEVMNNRATELGLKSTNFVTPSGLHDDNHYSTAYDMALLTRYAINNDDFLSICSQKEMYANFGNPPKDRYFKNHNKLLEMVDGCIGVKTGYTKKAGRCLVSACTRNGVTLIAVTLNAADDWNVHKDLYDYGFNKIAINPISNDMCYEIDIVGGTEEKLKAFCDGEIFTTVDENNISNLKKEVLLQKFYYAPLKAGQQVGTINFYLEDKKVASCPLVVKKGVEKIEYQKKKWFIFK